MLSTSQSETEAQACLNLVALHVMRKEYAFTKFLSKLRQFISPDCFASLDPIYRFPSSLFSDP